MFLYGKLPEGDIKKETELVMRNIGAILEANGMDYANLVKRTVFLTDIRHYQTVNKIYGSFFKGKFPAREVIEVVNLPLGARIEISGVASK